MIENMIIKAESSDPHTIKFMTDHGAPILGVTGCVIHMGIEELTSAELTLLVTPETIRCNALLSLTTIEEAAALHGYKLVPVDE